MAEALKVIVARDGWKGLRRGMSARVVTFAPSTAISWASYEFFSEYSHTYSFLLDRSLNLSSVESLIKSQDYNSTAMA
jgi:hypothetical protein